MKLVGLLRMVLPNYQPGYEMLKGPLFFLFSCCLSIWKIDELVTMETLPFSVSRAIAEVVQRYTFYESKNR